MDVKMMSLQWPASSPHPSPQSAAASAESVEMDRDERANRVRREADNAGRRPRKTGRQRKKKKDDVACHLRFHLNLRRLERRLIENGERVDLADGVYDPHLGFRPTRVSENEPFVHKHWKVEEWAEGSRNFNYDHHSGRLRVDKPGLYHIYAQILYHNAATRSSFTVMVDDETFIQCWTSVDAVSANTTSADNARYKTCYTAGTIKLASRQEIWIQDLYSNHVSPNTNSSFFGIYKL